MPIVKSPIINTVLLVLWKPTQLPATTGFVVVAVVAFLFFQCVNRQEEKKIAGKEVVFKFIYRAPVSGPKQLCLGQRVILYPETIFPPTSGNVCSKKSLLETPQLICWFIHQKKLGPLGRGKTHPNTSFW